MALKQVGRWALVALAGVGMALAFVACGGGKTDLPPVAPDCQTILSQCISKCGGQFKIATFMCDPTTGSNMCVCAGSGGGWDDVPAPDATTCVQ